MIADQGHFKTLAIGFPMIRIGKYHPEIQLVILTRKENIHNGLDLHPFTSKTMRARLNYLRQNILNVIDKTPRLNNQAGSNIKPGKSACLADEDSPWS